jgi:hypothetical protein
LGQQPLTIIGSRQWKFRNVCQIYVTWGAGGKNPPPCAVFLPPARPQELVSGIHFCHCRSFGTGSIIKIACGLPEDGWGGPCGKEKVKILVAGAQPEGYHTGHGYGGAVAFGFFNPGLLPHNLYPSLCPL